LGTLTLESADVFGYLTAIKEFKNKWFGDNTKEVVE